MMRLQTPEIASVVCAAEYCACDGDEEKNLVTSLINKQNMPS